jgi:serine/threonine protein kinase
MLTSSGEKAQLKLIDFGFAALVDGNNLTERLGTPGYVAPEILFGHPYGKKFFFCFKMNFFS